MAVPDVIVQTGVLAIAATYIGKVAVEVVRQRRQNGKEASSPVLDELRAIKTEITGHGPKLDNISQAIAGLRGFVEGSKRD